MSSVKCPRCGLTNWETDAACRRCGSGLRPAGGGGAALALKKSIFFVALIAAIGFFGYKFLWPQAGSPLFPNTATNSGAVKKPLNVPGERIEVAQYLTPGKNTIAYFYADW